MDFHCIRCSCNRRDHHTPPSMHPAFLFSHITTAPPSAGLFPYPNIAGNVAWVVPLASPFMGGGGRAKRGRRGYWRFLRTPGDGCPYKTTKPHTFIRLGCFLIHIVGTPLPGCPLFPHGFHGHPGTGVPTIGKAAHHRVRTKEKGHPFGCPCVGITYFHGPSPGNYRRRK